MYSQRSPENMVRKPQRCGHEAWNWLKKKSMKDIENACKPPID
jgi:hypothetical protein